MLSWRLKKQLKQVALLLVLCLLAALAALAAGYFLGSFYQFKGQHYTPKEQTREQQLLREEQKQEEPKTPGRF